MRDHILVRESYDGERLADWLATSTDGYLFDPDVLQHESTFLLEAFDSTGLVGILPVQRPLMIESFATRPGLTQARKTLALTRLVEHAVEVCCAKDAGEIYFLSRDPATLEFSEKHLFRALPHDLQARRLNLAETFG